MTDLPRLYAQCLSAAAKGVAQHLWVVLLPFLYAGVMVLAAMLLGNLGPVSGLIMSLLRTAILSSLLYFVGETVAGQKFHLAEFKKSMGAYFWPVMAVQFVLWVMDLVLEPVFQGMPNGAALSLTLSFALFILLNATPEVLYQRGIYGGIATITESIKFLQENWIEWLVPNLALGAGLYFGLPALAGVLGGNLLLVQLAAVLFFFPLMVFRGHLFKILSTTTARQRALRNRGM